MLESRYLDAIKEWFGDRLSGTQLVHESVSDTRLYLVYTTDGEIEIVRLFVNYFTKDISISIERQIKGIDHTLMSLKDLMLIVETVVNTIKGED